jgi:hypothetical protein
MKSSPYEVLKSLEIKGYFEVLNRNYDAGVMEFWSTGVMDSKR